jgi:hypothetical protein
MTTKDWSPLHNPSDSSPREPQGSAALARLVQFRRSRDMDDLVDAGSGLTTADLDEVIELARLGEASVLPE